MAVLLVQKGISELGEITLDQTDCVLGSSKKADIVLDNPYVSRRHAQIVLQNDRFRILDLRSKNGTFVNGSRVGEEGQWLLSGDTIELPVDEVVLSFQELSGAMTRSWTHGEAELAIDAGSREVLVGGVSAPSASLSKGVRHSAPPIREKGHSLQSRQHRYRRVARARARRRRRTGH